MASFFPFGRIKYSDYLQAEYFVRDITGAIKRAGDQSASVARMIADSGAATRATIADQTRTLEWGLDRVWSSIEDLNASFSYNIGLVVAQLEVQNRLLLGIAERLDAIHETIENQTQNLARESFRMGCGRLTRGLLVKALEAFHMSESKNDTDYLTQLQLGRLYLYGKNEEDNVVDLEKARGHLLLAARYGKAEIAFLPDAAASAGEALLHAAIAYYLLASEARLAGDEPAVRRLLDESVRLALEAGELRPKLGEAHYHAAGGFALLAKPDSAVRSLERAIRLDRQYTVKADTDANFTPVRNVVADMELRLRQEAQDKAREACLSLDAQFDSVSARHKELELQRVDLSDFIAHNRLSDSGIIDLADKATKTSALLLQVTNLRARIAALWESGTYFDYLDILPVVSEATGFLRDCAKSAQTIAQKLTQVRQQADQELTKRNADLESARSDLRAAGVRRTAELRTLNGAMTLVVLAVALSTLAVVFMSMAEKSGGLYPFGPIIVLTSLGAPVAFAVANSMCNWRGRDGFVGDSRHVWWWGIVLGFLIFFPALLWLFLYPGDRRKVKAQYETARREAQARLDRLTGKVK